MTHRVVPWAALSGTRHVLGGHSISRPCAGPHQDRDGAQSGRAERRRVVSFGVSDGHYDSGGSATTCVICAGSRSGRRARVLRRDDARVHGAGYAAAGRLPRGAVGLLLFAIALRAWNDDGARERLPFALAAALRAAGAAATGPASRTGSPTARRCSSRGCAWIRARANGAHAPSAVVVQLTGDVDMTLGADRTRRSVRLRVVHPEGRAARRRERRRHSADVITVALKRRGFPRPRRPPMSRRRASRARPSSTTRGPRRPRAVHAGRRRTVHTHANDLVTVQLTGGRLEIVVGDERTVDDRVPGSSASCRAACRTRM